MHGYGNITVPQQSATFGELSDNDGTIAILLMSLAWAWDSNLQWNKHCRLKFLDQQMIQNAFDDMISRAQRCIQAQRPAFHD
jgi:hypothetical protein